MKETERLLFISQITFANFLNLALTSNISDELKGKLSDSVSDIQVMLVKEMERVYNEQKTSKQDKLTV